MGHADPRVGLRPAAVVKYKRPGRSEPLRKSYFSWLEMLLNVVFRFVPMRFTAATFRSSRQRSRSCAFGPASLTARRRRPVGEVGSDARMAVANPYKKGAESKPNALEFVASLSLLVDALDRQDAEARGDFAA